MNVYRPFRGIITSKWNLWWLSCTNTHTRLMKLNGIYSNFNNAIIVHTKRFWKRFSFHSLLPLLLIFYFSFAFLLSSVGAIKIVLFIVFDVCVRSLSLALTLHIYIPDIIFNHHFALHSMCVCGHGNPNPQWNRDGTKTKNALSKP